MHVLLFAYFIHEPIQLCANLCSRCEDVLLNKIGFFPQRPSIHWGMGNKQGKKVKYIVCQISPKDKTVKHERVLKFY